MGYWDIVTTSDVKKMADDAQRYAQRSSAVGASTTSRRRTTPAPTESNEPDDYLKRLVKFIPAETIAAYIALDNLMRSQDKVPKVALEWVVLALMIVYTYFHMKRIRRIANTKQVLLSVGAFVAWAAGNGGPFDSLTFWSPAFGSATVIIATLALPVIEPDTLKPPRR